jgi:hypothetical protein
MTNLVIAGVLALAITPEQWREDIALLARELPARHKNAFHTLSREEWEKGIAALESRAATASGIEMRAAITQLVSRIGDAHTSANLWSPRSFRLRFREFPEGMFVTEAAPEYREAAGARVVAIGGVPMDEVRRRVLPFWPLENEIATDAGSTFAFAPFPASFRPTSPAPAPSRRSTCAIEPRTTGSNTWPAAGRSTSSTTPARTRSPTPSAA